MQPEFGLLGCLMSGMGRLVSQQVGGAVSAEATVGVVDNEALAVVTADFGYGPLPAAAVADTMALLVQPAAAVVGGHD